MADLQRERSEHRHSCDVLENLEKNLCRAIEDFTEIEDRLRLSDSNHLTCRMTKNSTGYVNSIKIAKKIDELIRKLDVIKGYSEAHLNEHPLSRSRSQVGRQTSSTQSESGICSSTSAELAKGARQDEETSPKSTMTKDQNRTLTPSVYRQIVEMPPTVPVQESGFNLAESELKSNGAD